MRMFLSKLIFFSHSPGFYPPAYSHINCNLRVPVRGLLLSLCSLPWSFSPPSAHRAPLSPPLLPLAARTPPPPCSPPARSLPAPRSQPARTPPLPDGGRARARRRLLARRPCARHLPSSRLPRTTASSPLAARFPTLAIARASRHSPFTMALARATMASCPLPLLPRHAGRGRGVALRWGRQGNVAGISASLRARTSMPKRRRTRRMRTRSGRTPSTSPSPATPRSSEISGRICIESRGSGASNRCFSWFAISAAFCRIRGSFRKKLHRRSWLWSRQQVLFLVCYFCYIL